MNFIVQLNVEVVDDDNYLVHSINRKVEQNSCCKDFDVYSVSEIERCLFNAMDELKDALGMDKRF